MLQERHEIAEIEVRAEGLVERLFHFPWNAFSIELGQHGDAVPRQPRAPGDSKGVEPSE
jgi:hypothetical protein